MLPTVPEKPASEEESAQCLWNLIFNAAVECFVTMDSNTETARHPCTNQSLTSYMAEGESIVRFAGKQAALRMGLGYFVLQWAFTLLGTRNSICRSPVIGSF